MFAAGGNIAITGHDDDFHGSTLGDAQSLGMINFARSGSPTPSKPVLSFDHGSELTGLLTRIGVPYTNIDPDAGVPAASNFNVANYSAIVIASDSICGGGTPPSTGFTQTAFGATIGIPAVNGDPTHNFFAAPGTSGVSAAYSAVEILPSASDPNRIVTLACQGCTSSSLANGGATPIPPSILLSLTGLGILFMWFNRRTLFARG